MNHDKRKAILMESIKTLAADVANHADAIYPDNQAVQCVLDGIERLQRLGFCLQSEMKSNAILQDIKAREVQP